MKKYVIIGNSAAGIGCVQGIRSVDGEGLITIISDEPYHTYSRPLISYWLEGKVTDDKIYYREESFYDDNKVMTMLGQKAVKIEDGYVLLESGGRVAFDKLLVATGSKPFVPPMKGLDTVPDKYTFMHWDSAKAIKEKVKDNTRVLIIGAGLIGLKCAEALYHMNADITVVDLADRILPSILDVRGGEIMQKHIESKGTKFILNTSVEEFSGNTAKLTNGDTVDFDILVIAVGVRPNTELISEAGGKVEKGIVTDLMQETTIPNVYAAGDCTLSHDASSDTDKILALLPNAFLQGEVAGKNMAGEQTLYLNAIPMNAIGFYGLHIITAGSYDGESYITEDEGKEQYKKLVFKDGLLKGYILMGDVARAGIYTSMIREQIPLEDVDVELLKDKPQMMLFGKKRRDEKLAGIM